MPTASIYDSAPWLGTLTSPNYDGRQASEWRQTSQPFAKPTTNSYPGQPTKPQTTHHPRLRPHRKQTHKQRRKPFSIKSISSFQPTRLKAVKAQKSPYDGIAITVQPYGHTGRRHDDETGLQYFRARYFDANLGRFISRDPFFDIVNEMGVGVDLYYTNSYNTNLNGVPSVLSNSADISSFGEGVFVDFEGQLLQRYAGHFVNRNGVDPTGLIFFKLKAVRVGDPIIGKCGAFSIPTKWELTGKSALNRGGVIIQNVSIRSTAASCPVNGGPTDGCSTSIDYSEAWIVGRGANGTNMRDFDVQSGGIGKDDAFGSKGCGIGTFGNGIIVGTATFYNGMKFPPDGYKKGAVKNAGDLLYSKLEYGPSEGQKLGKVEGSFTKSVFWRWDCCKCDKGKPIERDTVIVSSVP